MKLLKLSFSSVTYMVPGLWCAIISWDPDGDSPFDIHIDSPEESQQQTSIDQKIAEVCENMDLLEYN
ncbi:hypothetical protein OROGR_017416 [Orobanche gracilis]